MLITAELASYRVQARDQSFGTTVTMNLLGELVDINLPLLYTDHYEDAWDKAAASVAAAADALQVRARGIAIRAIALPAATIGATDAQ